MPRDASAAKPSGLAMGNAEWAMLVALSLLWGASFFFGKIAVADIPPLLLVLARVGLAAAALFLILPLAGVAVPRGATLWRSFLVMGALNNLLPNFLIFWGQTQIPSGLAAILNATTPLFTVLFAHLATADERLTAARLGGVLAGFLGVVAMIGPDALGGAGSGLAGQLACLAAAASYACAGLYGKRFRDVPPLATAAGQLAGAAVLALPLALLLAPPWATAMPPASTLAAVVALALLSTALAYVLYFRILAAAGATNLLLVTFLIPVSALLLGTLALGERLEARHFLGMALIGAGLAAIDGRLAARLRRA